MSHKSNNRRPNQAMLYEALHKKRAAECEARAQWAGVNQYFKTWENNSNKFTDWTSPQYYQKCSEQQLEMRRQQQRKLEEEQEEIKKWQKKIQDRQREDEEFKKSQMKKKPVFLSRPSSASQKIPCEEMAMELKRKHDTVMDREIELSLHAQSKLCNPKQGHSSHLQIAAEYLTEEENDRGLKAKAVQLKEELRNQVAELKRRSDRCDELKKMESTYLLALQRQLEDTERRNERLEQKKTENMEIKNLNEKISMCLEEQRMLIGEREELIGVIENGYNELKQIDIRINRILQTAS